MKLKNLYKIQNILIIHFYFIKNYNYNNFIIVAKELYPNLSVLCFCENFYSILLKSPISQV